MLQVPWLRAGEPRKRVSCCRSTELLFIFATIGGMARLNQPKATMCKFPAHGNFAMTRVSTAATGFEPGTVQLQIQRALTVPPRRHGCVQ